MSHSSLSLCSSTPMPRAPAAVESPSQHDSTVAGAVAPQQQQQQQQHRRHLFVGASSSRWCVIQAWGGLHTPWALCSPEHCCRPTVQGSTGNTDACHHLQLCALKHGCSSQPLSALSTMWVHGCGTWRRTGINLDRACRVLILLVLLWPLSACVQVRQHKGSHEVPAFTPACTCACACRTCPITSCWFTCCALFLFSVMVACFCCLS